MLKYLVALLAAAACVLVAVAVAQAGPSKAEVRQHRVDQATAAYECMSELPNVSTYSPTFRNCVQSHLG